MAVDVFTPSTEIFLIEGQRYAYYGIRTSANVFGIGFKFSPGLYVPESTYDRIVHRPEWFHVRCIIFPYPLLARIIAPEAFEKVVQEDARRLALGIQDYDLDAIAPVEARFIDPHRRPVKVGIFDAAIQSHFTSSFT
jgi:hypothetical protein